MKLITNKNACVYYGDQEHSFDENGLLEIEGAKYSGLNEENITVYSDVTVPDDFYGFKYTYDGENFALSGPYLELSEEMRTERNTLLAETDWWAVSDRTMTQAETDYRQALRDVPQQDGFPVNITWPTKPE